MREKVVRIASIVLGILVIGHSLIHLGIIPGGLPGPDGKSGWSGASWLLDGFLSSSAIRAIGALLLAGTILFFVAGGLGLFGVPMLKRHWKAATIVGSVLSLLLFAVTWTGLLPQPLDAIWGPVISGVLLAGLIVDLLLERMILRPNPPLHAGA